MPAPALDQEQVVAFPSAAAAASPDWVAAWTPVPASPLTAAASPDWIVAAWKAVLAPALDPEQVVAFPLAAAASLDWVYSVAAWKTVPKPAFGLEQVVEFPLAAVTSPGWVAVASKIETRPGLAEEAALQMLESAPQQVQTYPFPSAAVAWKIELPGPWLAAA